MGRRRRRRSPPTPDGDARHTKGPAGPLQQEEADELQAARTANRELTRQLNVNAP
jgi:hypothetical protein